MASEALSIQHSLWVRVLLILKNKKSQQRPTRTSVLGGAVL